MLNKDKNASKFELKDKVKLRSKNKLKNKINIKDIVLILITIIMILSICRPVFGEEAIKSIDLGDKVIKPIYKPEWEKVSSTLDTTNKTLSVVVKGLANNKQTIDKNVGINYASDVTSKLSKEHITVFVDGVEVTNTTNPTVAVNTGTISTNATTGKAEVTHTITLSNLEEAVRQTGKPYHEWSGNIAIRIGGRGEDSSTYNADVLTDTYGNQNMMQTDENGTNDDGTWINVQIKDENVNANTDGIMFADYIKPEFTYQYNEGDINYNDKTLKVVFDVTDKYFASTSLATDNNASLITVKVSDDDAANSAIAKTLTKKNDIILNTKTDKVTVKEVGYTLGTDEKKVGERYELLIQNLQQNPNDGFKYSGIVTLGFGAGIITDTSGNRSNATKITIGVKPTGIDNTKPYLPTGYKYVSGDLDDGLVIADPLGNEYVWVEVPRSLDVYKNAGLNMTDFTAEISIPDPSKTDGSTIIVDGYGAIEQDLHDYTTVYRNGTSYTDNFPDDLVQAATGLTKAQYTELKQKMLRSVYQNGGFYVGRYETGIEDAPKSSGSADTALTETPVIKQNAYPYNLVTCSQAQTLSSGFASQLDGYTSSLMFGVQWDLVLKYLETKGVEKGTVPETIQAELNSDSTNWGNYGNNPWNITNPSSKYRVYDGEKWLDWTNGAYGEKTDNSTILLSTGASDTFSNQGIYDLAGNVWEWTLEYASSTSKPCTRHGGSCINSGNVFTSSKYNGESVTTYAHNIGFRVTLFKDADLNEESSSNESANGIIVDVVDPVWTKVSSTASAIDPENKASSTATITFRGEDKYFKESTLTIDDIKVVVNGEEVTDLETAGITKTLDETKTKILTEERLVDGVTKTVQYGVEYTVTIKGFAQNANQVKVRIPEGKLIDESGNSNKETDLIVYNVLKYVSSEDGETKPFLGGPASIERQNIENVTFESSLSGMNSNTAWDVSAQQDGSIMAWATQTADQAKSGVYTVHIGSNDEIFACKNSSRLFSYIGAGRYCKATEAVTNLDLLNVKSVTNMNMMFYYFGYKAMTSFSLPDTFDTSNVTLMNSMFTKCGYYKMTSFDLGNKFDTSNVNSMFAMFNQTGYYAMTSLDLGERFDTSNVTYMDQMFIYTGFNAMTSLDLGDKFDTRNVTNMKFMFLYTGNIAMTSLDLGDKFDTSNVTNMYKMFYQCGYTAMTSLKLGDKFNTSKVTDMCGMFDSCGYTAMTSLDLGDLFYTTNVKDMYQMFNNCGKTAMTSLDLGPAFTKIPKGKITKQESDYATFEKDKILEYNAYDDFMTNCGTSSLVIYAPESIYKNQNAFKLSSKDTTETPDSLKYTRGTINPIYKPGWEKVSDEIDTTNKTLSVVVKGSAYQAPQTIDNGKVTINYASNVTSKLSKEHITVYIDGVEVTNTVNPFVTVNEPTTSTKEVTVNSGTGSDTETKEITEVTHTITLSNLEEAVHQTGKPYKEWSGNIAIRVGGRGEATSTYTALSLVDIYGNQSMMQTDEGQTGGTWINLTFKDEETNQNTANAMFMDYIKPEFIYQYNEGDINYGDKTLKVVFDVADKYFSSTSLSTDSNAALINVKVAEDEAANSAVTKTLTKKNDLVLNTQTNEVTAKAAGYTLGENERKVGERYELVIKNLQQNPNDGFKYSGIVSLGFGAGVVTDTSGNQNNATKITIGRNATGTELPSTDYTKPYLPTGYSYAGGNLDTGLIIADPLGNEYVWVEVPRTEAVYKTAKLGITDFTDAEYKKIEDDLKDYTTVYRNGTSYTDNFPDNLVQEATGLSADQYKKLKKKMLRSVYQNGGFYVGRYETGIEDAPKTSGSATTSPTETPVIKQNAYPYNWVTCSQAQTLASGFASQLEGYTSSLMFGVQWDLVLKYLETKAVEKGTDPEIIQSELKKDSTNWGNYQNNLWNIINTKSKYRVKDEENWLNWTNGAYGEKIANSTILLSTGASDTFSKQEIYDLAGNVWEWTLEYISTTDSTCIRRGGGYRSYGYSYPASYRYFVSTTICNNDTGFRTALFKDVDLNADNNNNSNSNQTENGIIVDVVDPMWERPIVDIDNLTMKITVKDKYFDNENSSLTSDKMTVYVNRVEAPLVGRTVTGIREIYDTVDGVENTLVGKQYTIQLTNLESAESATITFTPSNLEEDQLDDSAGFKYKVGGLGEIVLEVAEGAIVDKSGNESPKKSFRMEEDGVANPAIYVVKKTQNASANTETIIFNVTDRDYDSTKLITKDEITIFMDGEKVDDIRINSLTAKPIKDKIDDIDVIVGHQYTLVLSNIAKTVRQTGKEYLEHSGTLEVVIAENSAIDQSGNGLSETTIRDFVDFIKPELRYTHQSTDIDKGTKTYTMTFDVTDKYYTSGQLSLDDLNIKMKNGQKDATGKEIVYDLKQLANAGEINVSLTATEKTAKFNKTVDGMLTNGTYTIGHTYKLVISNLEKVEIKSGLTTADYSGIITVEVAANKVQDNGPAGDGVEPNGNNATTITSGVNIGSGVATGDGVAIDVVSPIWTKVSSTAYAIDPANKASSTATITFKGTDTYFKESTLTIDDIQVVVNGSVVTSGITKTLDSTRTLTEARTVNGVNKTGVKYGVEYTVTIKGFAQNANQVKIRIPAGKITDESGNSNKLTDLIVYNTLRYAGSESSATSPFLGGPASIERQNIENVTFVNEVNNTSGLIRSFDAKNNTASGHSNTTTSWRDLSGNRDGIVNGGTWTDEYLTLDGVDDWVNLGEVSLGDQVTLDVTITVNENKSYYSRILGNWEVGGIGIRIGKTGIPELEAYTQNGVYVILSSSKALTVGEKTRITGTYDGTNMYLYVNGELVAQKAQTGKIDVPKNNTVMAIGVNPHGNKAPQNSDYANINVYSAKVYNTALTQAEINAWDVSAQGDGSIMAWATQTADQATRGVYTVHIGSNDEIFANQDSSWLFANIGYGESCTATEAITNLDLLNVKSVTNMYATFNRCGYTAMTGLILPDTFDTSNVTNMAYMFSNTGFLKMTSLKLCNAFDTSNVTNMAYMFSECGQRSMTKLELGTNFNTSNVTSMKSMFNSCGFKLKSLNLGNKFDTTKVTNMWGMFNCYGISSMETLNLGNKFNTSNVTDMGYMFNQTGCYALMKSLDLGEQFYTTNVVSMVCMFNNVGGSTMTVLDLGPAFTNIPSGDATDWQGNTISANSYFLTGAGKPGECTIYAPESIYKNKNAFKLGSSDTTETPDSLKYTRGTINPIYKPGWEKVSSSINTTNKTLSVTVKGSAYQPTQTIDNGNVKINYASNVNSRLSKEHITVFVDGVEVTNTTNPTVAVNAGTTSTNSTSKKTEVTHTITLSNLEEAIRQGGKSFKEWSGNIAIRIGGRGEATSTYTANVLTDIYGNQNMMQTDETGSWINVTFKDGNITSNTNGTMFADYVKPEFTYKYNEGDINYGDKTLKVVFDVTDKYFASTSLATNSNGSLITVNVSEDAAANNAVTKTLTKKNDLVLNTQTNTVTVQTAGYTLGANERKVGERYELLIKNLQQNPNDGYKYSGIVTLGFGAGIITDTSGNQSNATKITIGVNDTDGNTQDTQDPNGVIVDVVDPIWKTQNINIDNDNQKLTVDLIATDKYLQESALTANDITLYVHGQNITENSNINISVIPKAEANSYTLTITGWGGQAEGQPYIEWNGIRIIEIAENTITDQSGNTSEKRQIILEAPIVYYTPSFTQRDETELNYTTDSRVDITYTLYEEQFKVTPYSEGDYRVISTTTKLPAGTKLTLKDYVKDKTYYYHVTDATSYKAENGKYIYRLSDFIEMGSTDSKYEDSGTYYNGALEYVLEKYNLSIDFLDANINANKLEQETYLQLRNSEGALKYDNGETTIKYNLYYGKNAVMAETLSNQGQTYTIAGETEIPFTLNVSLTEQQVSGNKIIDTKYYDKIGGVAIEILNENVVRLKDAQTFKIVNANNSAEEYVADENGVIRIPLMQKPSAISKNYKLVIDPGTAPNGSYSINVHFFASDDGKHIGNEAKVSKQFNATFDNANNEQTLIKIDATNDSRVISQSTGLNLEGNSGIDMTITVGNPSNKTNVRVELYKRNSTFTSANDESTYTGTEYTLVDIKDYLDGTWQTPEEADSGLVSATNSKEYILLPRQTYESSVETTPIELERAIKANVDTGEYKLVIKSYNDNTLVETASKTFVVAK